MPVLPLRVNHLPFSSLFSGRLNPFSFLFFYFLLHVCITFVFSRVAPWLNAWRGLEAEDLT